jgi:hypothetical protein
MPLEKKVIVTSRARKKICVEKIHNAQALVKCMHSSLVTTDGSTLITVKQQAGGNSLSKFMPLHPSLFWAWRKCVCVCVCVCERAQA